MPTFITETQITELINLNTGSIINAGQTIDAIIEILSNPNNSVYIIPDNTIVKRLTYNPENNSFTIAQV